jgi:hypothetical protein
MAMGPVQKGPSHPLFLDPEYEPEHGTARQFKNNLSWTEPWGAETALRELEKLAQGWQEGVELWKQVETAAAPQMQAQARRAGGIGRALLSCYRSTINVGRFYQVRDRLYATKAQEQSGQLVDELVRIAEAELANARAALEVVSTDSRLGYANSVASSASGVPRAGIYSPGAIRKKIRQIERLLSEEIPQLRQRLG